MPSSYSIVFCTVQDIKTLWRSEFWIYPGKKKYSCTSKDYHVPPQVTEKKE